MGLFKVIYRIVKVLLFVFGFSNALLRSRWLTVGLALWRLLGRNRVRPVYPSATVMFVDGSEPAIYRRLGLRKYLSRRVKAK